MGIQKQIEATMARGKRKQPHESVSRYVRCPVCGSSTVPAFRINEHLDTCTTGCAALVQSSDKLQQAAAGLTGHPQETACAATQATAALPQPAIAELNVLSRTHMVQLQPPAQPVTSPAVGAGAAAASEPEAAAQPNSAPQPEAAQPAAQQPEAGSAARPAKRLTTAAAAAVHPAALPAALLPAVPPPSAALKQQGSPLLSRVPPVVTLRRADGRKEALSDLQLADHAPCEIVRNCLPSSLATQLLQMMLEDAEGWEQPVWHIFGQRHQAPRKSAYFELSDQQGLKDLTDDSSTADVSVNVDQRGAPDCLRQAASLIDDHVNRLASGSDRPLDDLDRIGWNASYCFGNLYRDGKDTTGAHADRLTLLGPRPIIASLSLGAARLFRVKRAVAASEKVVPTASSRKKKVKRPQPSVDVTLPHNSLLIMWPPCQEAWKHEVPRVSQVAAHPTAGTRRVNLTFRRLKPEFEQHVPQCKCGKRSILKAAYPKGDDSQLGVRELSGAQRYYFACDNTQSAGCGFYKRFNVS